MPATRGNSTLPKRVDDADQQRREERAAHRADAADDDDDEADDEHLAPMPGYTDETGAAIMPASTASATPCGETRRDTGT
mgnify:CR=1 FL=1